MLASTPNSVIQKLVHSGAGLPRQQSRGGIRVVVSV
jgi:hypothetical protein